MDKKTVYLVGSIGGTVGGYIPTLFHQSAFSVWGIIGGLVGGIGAIYAAYKVFGI